MCYTVVQNEQLFPLGLLISGDKAGDEKTLVPVPRLETRATAHTASPYQGADPDPLGPGTAFIA